jgi:hypothetical protein
MQHALVRELRARGIDVPTAQDAGMIEPSDEEQLRYARDEARVICTFNVGHFYRLHTEYLTCSEEHKGIILVPKQGYPVGRLMRAFLALVATETSESMRNRVEFLKVPEAS